MAEKFLIIDGSSLLHRAFFALPPLTTKAGVSTGAVYGLCNMLLKLLHELEPRYLAVAFDKSRRTFRTEIFAAYKGQRKPTPPELSGQFPLSMKVLDALGICSLELDDYEADDIIGTLASKAPQELEVIIVTGDRDELQLVDTRTKVYYTKRGISELQIFDEAEFAAAYEGLAPKQIIELKGLMGDASDNIPGVPGIGAKTAMKLIKEFGSVANVYANLEKVSAKALKNKLEANKESALMSQRLATICTEAPVALDMALYELHPVAAAARDFLQGLEFRNMFERFAQVLGSADAAEQDLFAEVAQTCAEAVQINGADAAAMRELFAALDAAAEPAAFAAKIGGSLPDLFFSGAEIFYDNKVYILDAPACASEEFLRWLASPRAKQTAESKEIYKCARCLGARLRGIADDVALAAYVADPGRDSYALADLAQRYLKNISPTDAENIARLAKILHERLEEREQEKLYRGLELPLAEVLARMECAGITPDLELLQQLGEDMQFRIARLESRAMAEAGENFNLKSPKQLGVVLFEHLELPVIKKTKTGYSTDVKVLEALRGKHPLIETILEHRKLAKLQSTYIDGLRPLVNPVTGRVHTHFQQTVAVTGRLSSTDPNLQNIPARTEEGRQIRRVFVPGEGYDFLLSCDYSQVELRILACIAQDELLLEAFRHNQDVHARTAAEVFGVPLDEVSPQMRRRAKAVNFGIVYGISDFGLAVQLDVPRKEAAGYIADYFARYTGVKKYMEAIVAEARAKGYVTTLMGRRRYLPDIRHSNFNLRSFAERTAINTPIQGTAADIMKKAMLDVQRALDEAGCASRILLQVHDELVLEVVASEKEKVAALVRTAMENAVKLAVPLPAEANFGKNWAETK